MMIGVIHKLVFKILTSKIAMIMARKTLKQGIQETRLPLFETAQRDQLAIFKQAQRHHPMFK